MNVFEDLIDELKDENLLENTVVSGRRENKNGTAIPGNASAPEFAALDEQMVDMDSARTNAESSEDRAVEIEIIDTPKPAERPKKRSGNEYFKKRAIAEVSSLQMVEHILTGVEREYLKVVPKAFDDFNVKKALHNFVSAADDPNSDQFKAADLALRQETEGWGLVLLERDRNVPVANIRHYCENSRPALSSQAILALARFYRNAPYSENTRAKFDFVITRLFSRPVEHDRRVCLFGRDEVLGHIRTLYGEWSSVPLYDADDDESNVLLTGLSFDDLAIEAERAATFDQLIESDFFGRVRLFKESISELFFAPTVIASAIECNVRVGNAYVGLIIRERRKMDSASVQVKYGEFNDRAISDAAGRTLDLVELLKGLTDEALEAEEPPPAEPEAVAETDKTDKPKGKAETKKKKERSPVAAKLIDELGGINKWLLGVGTVLIVLCAGLYVWSTFMIDDKVSTAGVESVTLDGTERSY